MFEKILNDVIKYSEKIGLKIHFKNDLDEYFKGDLDGVNIFCIEMEYEEMLFNILHMIGHTVQWNVDNDLRELGSKTYLNPELNLMLRLQDYEWEANCYGLYILHHLGVYDLDKWLYDKFILDISYLTHFYATGEKLREITSESLKYPFSKLLIPKAIPSFNPYKSEGSRNGVVIDFSK
jgi:hypothetical protein